VSVPAGALAAIATLGALAALATTLWLIERRRRGRVERDLRTVRDQAAAADRDRDAFFDLATHELRSPLAAILGYQELLGEGAYGDLPESCVDPIQRVGRSARHLMHLIDGVVELGRLRAGTVQPELETVHLQPIVDELAGTFRHHARERGLEPHVQVPDEAEPMVSDDRRLTGALDLLVTSAVKHPAGSELHLRIERDDDGLLIDLRPTAIQIRSADDPAAGLGIRLAVVDMTARLLGGRLHLDTEDEVVRAVTLRLPDPPPGGSGL
jgi:signal transduction histidine kinase